MHNFIKILPSKRALNASRNMTAQTKHPTEIITIKVFNIGNSKSLPVTR